MLLLKEWDGLSQLDIARMLDVQTGDRAFRIASLERVLRRKQRVACCACSEDLAHVIQVLAPRIASPDLQLLEEVIGAEFGLESIIVRGTAIVARTDNACPAIHAAH